MAIRYDDQLISEIRRTVKNYQAKRRRLAERGQDLIPDAAYVSSLMSDYTSRRELLRELKRLQRFSVKGAEEVVETEGGVRALRYDIEETKRMAAQAKRSITLQLKRADLDPNIAQPLTRGYYQNLAARYAYLSRNINRLTPRQFKSYQQTAWSESDISRKNRLFKNNVFTMIDQLGFGVSGGVINQLKKALNGLNTNQLANLLQSDPQMSAILDYYEVMKAGGEVDSLEDRIENLIEYINAL